MNLSMKNGIIRILILLLLTNLSCATIEDDRIVFSVINPKRDKIQFFWTDYNGVPYRSIQNLKQYAEKQSNEL